MLSRLDDSFLTQASEILAATDSGLSGTKIVEHCNAYAIDFNRVIPYGKCPLDTHNKRTALKENLRVFDAAEQFRIIKELCELPVFAGNEKVKELKTKMYRRYGNLAKEKISQTELILTTESWLAEYPRALKQYENALLKFEAGIFERNTLDDIRLSFELLVKDLLGNEKSLENQISGICGILDKIGTSVELKNMVLKIIDYYTKFQNNHVKHGDVVNKKEVEYVIELTSVIMKFLIRSNRGN